MIRILLFILIFLSLTSKSFAQIFEDLEDVREYQLGLKANLGVYNGSFQKSEFSKNEKFGKSGTGLILGGGFNVNPVSLDADFFFSRYDSTHLKTQLSSTDTVWFRGGAVSLSYNLLPRSKYFYPYIGAGYQFSKISSKSKTLNENTSNAFWKTGIQIIFSYKWSAKLEFSKSFPSNFKTEGSGFSDWQVRTTEKKNTLQMLSIIVSYNFLNEY